MTVYAMFSGLGEPFPGISDERRIKSHLITARIDRGLILLLLYTG